MSANPFNMNHITDENLNEVPEDVSEMEKGLQLLLENCSKETDEVQKAAGLAKAGVIARVLGDYSNSAKLLTESITILKENNKKSRR